MLNIRGLGAYQPDRHKYLALDVLHVIIFQDTSNFSTRRLCHGKTWSSI